ncbi:bifunctional folylpolyglutamate synthase/dihydrofolate synthase [Weissella viridescens]|uniref:tetrahydrofolate synthase n=1 Tax=Weissella viridescens TaxID=1629 RepID=A0A3P2RMU0_WEIVI|nr:folylpolyglutamate synthase/dihydrofolate synthase family protein [Weissella viridescens]RRG18848.1 bifunctional folylpolyglutamate synthase/dihydrofolate synthase [Weissella viridescens]
MVKIENVDDAIAYIHSRHKWQKTPSFERINRLLAALDHPEKANRYIHVTGTNGKGSTSKMITQILRTAGLQVGMFSSPFIERFNERIQDNDGLISDAALTAAVQKVAPITEQLDQALPGGPTEFETLTAVMFVYFAQHPMDVVVLEVGVGGMWDTTEVIPDKLAAVITNVGLDHMKVLGNTLGEIAEQKAGIIAPHRPVILGPLVDSARGVIEAKAHALGAPILAYGDAFTTVSETGKQQFGETFDFIEARSMKHLELALTGDYQQVNASLAIETVLTVAPDLGIKVPDSVIRTALKQVTWPARFEKIADHPLTIIDGAHNPQGIAALKQTLAERFPTEPINLIVGILADKRFDEMLGMLAELPNVTIYVAHFDAPHQRQDIDASAIEVPGATISYVTDWYALYQQLAPIGAPIIFTGSLYFVSEVRAKIKSNELGETDDNFTSK